MVVKIPKQWLHLIACSHCCAENFPPGSFKKVNWTKPPLTCVGVLLLHHGLLYILSLAELLKPSIGARDARGALKRKEGRTAARIPCVQRALICQYLFCMRKSISKKEKDTDDSYGACSFRKKSTVGAPTFLFCQVSLKHSKPSSVGLDRCISAYVIEM